MSRLEWKMPRSRRVRAIDRAGYGAVSSIARATHQFLNEPAQFVRDIDGPRNSTAKRTQRSTKPQLEATSTTCACLKQRVVEFRSSKEAYSQRLRNKLPRSHRRQGSEMIYVLGMAAPVLADY